MIEVFGFGLDRLTVVGRMKRYSSSKQVKIGKKTKINEVDAKVLRMLRGEEDFKGDSLDCLLDSIWLKITNGVDYKSYIYDHWFKVGQHCFIQVRTGKESKGNDFRMDWNPGKLEEDEEWFVHELLNHVVDKEFTRIDLKMDLRADLSKGWKIIDDSGKRASRGHWAFNGDLETMYFGTPNSNRETVIYDKAIEQNRGRIDKADEDERERIRQEIKYEKWWRIEDRIKRDKARKWRDFGWFEGIKLVKDGVDIDWKDIDLKPNDKASVIACSVCPELLKEFGKAKRKKIKDLLKMIEIKKSTTTIEVADFFKEKKKEYMDIKKYLETIVA